MCGRFALAAAAEEVDRVFSCTPRDPAPPPPRWNIAPTQRIDAVLIGAGAGRLRRGLRWGFVPRWSRAPDEGPLIINARAETLAQKPAFREACRKRRCLIPATGFYEWRREGRRRQPFYISPARGGLMAMAGVWEEWSGPDGRRIASCAIVTVAAGPQLRPIHDREPLVIAPEAWGKWLGEEGPGAALLMHPAPEGFFALRKVSPRVNRATEDGPELIEPWSEEGEAAEGSSEGPEGPDAGPQPGRA